MKLVPENINEVRNFERSTNLNKSLQVGKYNPDLWRQKHNGKPIIEVVINISTPRGSKLIYRLPLIYGMDWEGYKDTVYFGGEKLTEDGTQIPMSALDGPYGWFWGAEANDEERTMCDNPEFFEKKWIQNLVDGNAEEPFEDLMTKMQEGQTFKDAFQQYLEEGGNTMEDIKYISL